MVRGGDKGIHEQRMLDNNFISIGWSELPDLSGITQKEELQRLYKDTYPEAKENRMKNHVNQIWQFISKIQKEDMVAVPLKAQSAIAVGKVSGEYQYVTDQGIDLRHKRSVEWIKTDIPRTKFDQDLLYSLGAFMTVCQISRNNAENRVRGVLSGTAKPKSGVEIGEISEEREVNIEQNARDQIMRFIEYKFKGHALSELVESILRAQGYTTKRSAPGPDGGVDILAGAGNMGFDEPRLCVQVKSSSSSVDVTVYRSLIGTMSNFGAKQGLLVSWSGFNRKVIEEANKKYFDIRLWDSGDLIDEVIKNYGNLSENIQALLPLKKIWVLVEED